MGRLGHLEWAKYPFLADAGEYLRDTGFTLAQLAEDPDMEPIRDHAFARVTAAVDEGLVYNPTIQNSSQLPQEVFSFLLAGILLKMSDARQLTKKFAMQEARGAEARLERDLGKASTDSQVLLATQIIRDLSGVHIQKQEEGSFMVSVHEYLQRAVTLHAKEWKLVNRHVESGMVYLTPHETVRLVRQEIIHYITSRIQKATTPETVSGLSKFVSILSAMEKRFQPRMVSASGEFAPCIHHAIKTLADGENLSHAGRFMLATYLLGRGMPVDDIIPYFKKAPDYKESVTTYQLQHLAGKIGTGTAYKCQSCQKLKTLGLCHQTAQCAGITNPLQFGAGR